MRSLRHLSAPAVIVAALLASCDEDRAPVVKTPPATGPTTNVVRETPEGKNPISGHRKSTYGKAYDVAENLVDNEIPEYNRRLEKEMEPEKRPNEKQTEEPAKKDD